VLFYREQQSVTRVAELLDLSTDAVKQRLSRGRNLLRAEVAVIVERRLLQSVPGRAFTVGVIASLPIMTGTAKAATVTAVAAKGSRAALGWVAIGDRAFGILFASGNLAAGGIATGAVSVGFVSFGALAIGAIATGGAALGLGGLGGFAVGFLAAGGVAFGWKAAQGGIAVAHDIAVGGLVSGKHANDEVARAFVADSLFFKLGELMMTPWAWWLLIAVALAPYFIVMRKIRGQTTKSD